MTDQNPDQSPESPGGHSSERREDPVRLQKVLADAGVGSRRSCEAMIEDGRVRVNGRIVDTLPVLVRPTEDTIQVDNKTIPKPQRAVYVMLYKPRNTVSTLDDPDGRRTVADIVQHPSGARLYPVGRLDYDTMGLLLMTNDGDFANHLTHPRYGVHKTYRAVVRGGLTDDDIAELERGIYLALRKDGVTIGAERTGGAQLEIVRREHARTIIDITLTEGRNRQVRRMLASVGHHVKKLTRVSMGPVKLKGLRLGEWRELTPGEVQALRRAAKPGGQKGVERREAGARKKTRRQGSAPSAKARGRRSGRRR